MNLYISKLSFQRVVCKIINDFQQNIHFQKFAIDVLQKKAKSFFFNVFEKIFYILIVIYYSTLLH